MQIFDDIENSYVNPKEYYSHNEELLEIIPYKDATGLLSEADVIKTLRERGFTDSPITTEYTSDGTMITTKEAEDSDETHPNYQTYLLSDSGEYWTISVTMRSIIANPVGYNMECNKHGVQLVVAESEVMTCYDSKTNSFYNTKPNKSELIIKQVDRIDAETLNSLTVDQLEYGIN